MWFSTAGFGCTWKAVQVKVKVPEQLDDYAFRGDDEDTFIDDTDEDDKDEDEDDDDDEDEGEDEDEDEGDGDDGKSVKVVKRKTSKA